MRIFARMAAAVVFLMAVAIPAGAQHADFVGRWSGELTVLLEVDDEIVQVPRIMNVVIEQVDGNLVRGYRHWQAVDDVPGNVDGVNVLDAREPFIGAIDSDGVTLRLVEVDDFGMLFFERLSAEELEVTYLETAPHAVVFSAVLRKAKDE